MKFLHEKRMMKKETLGLEDKATRSIYNKAMRLAKMALAKEKEENSYVTKSDYELVTGIKPDEKIWGNVGTKKYISKYGMYRGVNPTKERR